MKKLLAILVVLLCALPISKAQDVEGLSITDSLLRLLPKAKEDTNKADILVQLSFSYIDTDPDKGIKRGQEALALAQKLGWKKGIADAYGRIGVNYDLKGEYGPAFEYYFKSLDMFKEMKFKPGIAKQYCNIGAVYEAMTELPKALHFEIEALKIFEEIRDEDGVARMVGNIGNVYLAMGENNKALDCYKRALATYEKIGDKRSIARNVGNIALFYKETGDYRTALKYSFRALAIYKELDSKNGMAMNYGNIGLEYQLLGNYDKAFDYYTRALNLKKELGDKFGMAINFGNIGLTWRHVAEESSGSDVKKRALQKGKLFFDSAIALYKELGELGGLMRNYMELSKLQSLMGDDHAALESHKAYTLFKDSIFNLERDKKLTQTAMQYDFDKKEAASKADQDKKDIRQRTIRNSIAGGLAGALIFLGVVYRQRNRISSEKKRSEELLLNILPGQVAEELKAKGSADAKLIDEVTVLFTDFKGFTVMSETLGPKELVQDIHECFSAFDHIMERNGMEKIKTIGDVYMAAGGLPSPNETHAIDAVKAAIEIRDFISEGKAKKLVMGTPYFEIRIGIHTGPVVAGIVGVKKFQYDIWGDTVNTASRMESSGEVGMINISGATYELVKNQFQCEHRGKVTAKGKGEIDMYFVSGVA